MSDVTRLVPVRGSLRNGPFWVVLVIELAALGYAGMAPQHWLRAVGAMAGGMLVAGVSRLVFSDEQAGLLRVRGRKTDVLLYIGLGVLAITFGLALPQR